MRRSMRRATTIVTSMTTTDDGETHPRAHAPLFDGRPALLCAALSSREPLPGRETLVGAVPEPDLVLAELPAQQHVFFAALRREVEEPLLERLHLRSCLA